MIERYYLGLDPGGATGTACYFDADTDSSGGSNFQQETKNIVGAADAVVNVRVTTYTVTNVSGRVLVNSSEVYYNNSFNITLDGSGNGSFVARVEGDPTDTGSVVFAIFSIESVTDGYVGYPSTKGISKVF